MIVIGKKRNNKISNNKNNKRAKRRKVIKDIWQFSCVSLVAMYSFSLLGCTNIVSQNSKNTTEVLNACETVDSQQSADVKGDSLSQSEADNNKQEAVGEEITLPSYEVTDFDAIKYATTSLNVRSGPTTNYDIIGYFFVNEEVTVTGQADTGWYRVDYLGEEAYASDQYLADEQVEVPVVIDTTEESSEAAATLITPETEELTEVVADTTQNKNYVLNTSIDGTGIVFIGDSRTVAMYLTTRDNSNVWVGAVGKGRDWFVNYGSLQADPYIVSGTKVVINLGVNDTRQVAKYIEDMNKICQTWIDRGASIYYLSVNPLDYSKYVDNDDIVAFNNTLSAGLSTDIKWIDSYSYLMENGYTTVDGIHYSHDTSWAIYNFCLANL